MDLTRRTNRNRKRVTVPTFLLLGIVAGGFWGGGCAGTPRSGGSSLSEAVVESKRARKPRNRGERRVSKPRSESRPRLFHAGRRAPARIHRVVAGYSCDCPRCCERRERSNGESDEERSERQERLYLVGMSLGGTRSTRGELADNTFFSLQGGGLIPGSDRRSFLMVELGAGANDATGPLAGGFRDPFELAAGICVRHYLTPPHTFSSAYISAGVEGSILGWDYASPVLIEEYGWVREVGDDWVGSFAPFIGIGFTMINAGDLRVGTSVRGGYRVYSPYTHSGLRNDLLEDAPYAQVRLELTHSFR